MSKIIIKNQTEIVMDTINNISNEEFFSSNKKGCFYEGMILVNKKWVEKECKHYNWYNDENGKMFCNTCEKHIGTMER